MAFPAVSIKSHKGLRFLEVEFDSLTVRTQGTGFPIWMAGSVYESSPPCIRRRNLVPRVHPQFFSLALRANGFGDAGKAIAFQQYSQSPLDGANHIRPFVDQGS